MKADEKQIVRLLKTARGQIDGILKMVEEDRYCVDISNQIMATDAILRKANKEILRAHMKCCVKDALETGQEDKKIDELIDMIDKIK
ncbi:MAG: metal-sensing transcriptional repressor [Firmicutes bacterium]|jgi:DNA-binding FrmR family transcriptional regulator|nr:metal-sensing transcriptional repressor [Bacillota bacterium]